MVLLDMFWIGDGQLDVFGWCSQYQWLFFEDGKFQFVCIVCNFYMVCLFKVVEVLAVVVGYVILIVLAGCYCIFGVVDFLLVGVGFGYLCYVVEEV